MTFKISQAFSKSLPKLLLPFILSLMGIGLLIHTPSTYSQEIDLSLGVQETSQESLEFPHQFFHPFLPNWIVERVVDDFLFLRRLEFKNGTTPMSHKFFGNKYGDGRDYIQFLFENIQSIDVDYNKICGEKTAACATYDGMIHISANVDEWQDESMRIARLAVLIHEATHNKTQVGHVNCPRDRTYVNEFVAGTQSCDRKINRAYGHTYVFLNNLEKNCTNCTTTDFKIIALAKKTYKSMILNKTKALEE